MVSLRADFPRILSGITVALLLGAPVWCAPVTNLTAKAANLSFSFVNEKTGKILCTGTTTTSTAGAGSTENDLYADLRNVRGVMYADNKPANSFTAPHVVAYNANKLVVATGGIRVVSLSEPGTWLTCDRMTYYAAQGKIIGTGHVVFKNTVQGFTQRGPSFAADTRLKRVVMPAPGMGRGVSADWQGAK